MLGGYSPVENLDAVTTLVSQQAAAINGKLGSNGETFTVNAAQSQVVAGTNYWIHLTSSSGQQSTIRITVGLDGAATVTDSQVGHAAP